MQAAAREHWDSLAQTGNVPNEPAEFGFYHPWEYVRLTGQLFVLSGFRVMPREGGLDDQDALWVEDMMVYLAGLHYYRWANEPPPGTSAVPAAMPSLPGANWLELMPRG